jgi:hypothetical protein
MFFRSSVAGAASGSSASFSHAHSFWNEIRLWPQRADKTNAD